jgi:hypothetical protein
MMRDHKDNAEEFIKEQQLELLRLSANKKTNEVIEYLSKQAITGGVSNIKGLATTNLTWNKNFCFIEDDDLKIDTEKWNPVTFAIFTQNLPLVRHFLEKTECVVSKSVFLPWGCLSEEKQVLFPLLYSFEVDNEEIFLYFLSSHKYLWKEDVLSSLIKFMLRSEQDMLILVKYLTHVLTSEVFIALFH